MYGIFKVRRTEDDWRQQSGGILFTWSILNPNGPTLSCVGIRECADLTQIEVYYRWLHFLGGESFVLGFVDKRAEDFSGQVLEVLRYAFAQETGRALRRFPLVTCVPSFVTTPGEGAAYVSDDSARALITGSPKFREADWGREMYYLRKHGSDFFGRAGEETRAALEQAAQDPSLDQEQRKFLEITHRARENAPGFQRWLPDQYTSRPLADDDAANWWSTVSDPQFTTSGLSQLAHMWVGSIHQSTLQPVETFDTVKEFLQSQQCEVWPDEWDTRAIRQRMGLRDMDFNQGQQQ